MPVSELVEDRTREDVDLDIVEGDRVGLARLAVEEGHLA
ncbi:MAG: hypothetical protein QG571_529, partial [Pseudomonadota bacterium]|nr:hypothetical protein [Pseudomonadota bacterium]